MHSTRAAPKAESEPNEHVKIFFQEHKAAQAIICSVKVPKRSVKLLKIELNDKNSNKFSERMNKLIFLRCFPLKNKRDGTWCYNDFDLNKIKDANREYWEFSNRLGWGEQGIFAVFIAEKVNKAADVRRQAWKVSFARGLGRGGNKILEREVGKNKREKKGEK